MKINLVLWGLGRHSITKLIPAIKKSKKINLYGLFTRNKKVLRQQSKKLSCKIWNNQKSMLLDNKIDVVYLATPIGLHYKQGKEILKSGKNLWSEKSLANNYKQVKDLVKIAKIVHPEVRTSLNNFIKKNQNKKFVVLDIPLLLENKINRKEDILIFVNAKKKEINKRLKQRYKNNLRIVKKFKKFQLPVELKKKKSDFIVKNDFRNNKVKKNVKKVLEKIILNV